MEGNSSQVVEHGVKIVSYMSCKKVKVDEDKVCEYKRGGRERERERERVTYLATFQINASVKKTDWFYLHKVFQITKSNLYQSNKAPSSSNSTKSHYQDTHLVWVSVI